jgi:nitrogen-specific signal transduction histidine kinase/CheY-like chemotaxis protein
VVLLLVTLVVALTMTYVVDRLTRQAEERIRAQAALEESRRVETLARLSGGIAHDFNNALTVIIGAADTARLNVDHPEAMRCLDDVIAAAQGAGELTRQLLTLGRRQVSKPESVRVAPLLARLETSIRRLLASDISIEVTIDDPEIAVLVDPIQLERSLYNLLLNARDAMPQGGRLTIASGRATARAVVAISVGDSGHGMDAETLSHIFEPFFTTKEVGKGTGLGLASVKAFAAQAGGDVLVSSEPGQGTVFTLELPEQQSSTSLTAPTDVIRVRTQHRKPVLVVEDRADVRASMVRTLTHGGFTVTEASDGAAALALLGDARGLALLCIDGVMPGLSTAEVLKRANEIDSSLPVLLCSGHVQEDLLRRGIETGRYAFLEKPFSAQQLLDKVHGLIDASPTRRK